jgi:hypothetical protein
MGEWMDGLGNGLIDAMRSASIFSIYISGGVQKWKCTGLQMGFDKEVRRGRGTILCMYDDKAKNLLWHLFRSLCYF